MERRFPIGAEVQRGGGAHFRVWAPASRSAAVAFLASDGTVESIAPLTTEPDGYFSGLAPAARAGARYKIKLDHQAFPDPASRFQPEGPHGPSEIIDPAFAWTDGGWEGREPRDLVIYELHVGTFTPEGTWRAAMEQLPELARIGITMIEVMPVAEFPGRFGWGYDGVDLFAPTRLYGTPDDARTFVDRAHDLGIAAILDVVYNHVGPDGNFLAEFAPDYFSRRYQNEWGQPMNFDGPNAGPVREFFATNARYWIEEFHFDGLRLDATQQMFDASPTHVVAEIAEAARAGGRGRRVFVVGENECQHARLARPRARGGHGLDAIWNDDFHHSAHVAATGRAEAYYRDYRGTAQEFVSAVKYGFLYQGSWCGWQQQRRGRPAFDLRAENFVAFLENHDQIANSLRGLRLHELTSPGKLRALTALLLLAPQIPLLFQGQEFGAAARFVYFADHQAGLRNQVRDGRRKFLQQFPSIATPDAAEMLDDPGAEATFAACKLDFAERVRNIVVYRLHEDLLRLRREEPVVTRAQRVDGAVLAGEAFVLRYFSADGDDRLLIVNLGADFAFAPSPEPLLAPLENRGWRVQWSSEAPAYGGSGTPALETTANWQIPGHAAVWLHPHEHAELPAARLSEKD